MWPTDEFNSILDRCLQDIAAGRETVESCLQRYPQRVSALAPLLKTASQLRAVAPLPPLPIDKRRVLEYRLLKSVPQAKAPTVAPRHVRVGPQRFAFSMLAVVVLVALLTTTTVAASAGSLPGEVLYPVKRLTEQVRLSIASTAEQPALHLELARRRLTEFSTLADRNTIQTDLLDDVSRESAEALDETAALPTEAQAVLLTDIVQLSELQEQALDAVTARVDDQTRGRLTAAKAEAADKRTQAEALMSHILPTPEPTGVTVTKKPKSETDTPEATDTPQLHTPPGQLNPNQDRTPPGQQKTPPGQQKTPQVPPGQQKPPQVPPGQANNPPKPKK